MGVTKHGQIAESLRQAIRDNVYPSGSKIPSENELCRTLSVSRQTVRQAIGTLESEGLLVRVRGSGTFVRSKAQKKRKRSRRIGVIVTCLDDYVIPSVIQGIESVLSAHEYMVAFGITYNKLENEEKVLRQMMEAGVDGLIVEGTKSALPNPNHAVYEELRAEGIPFVFIDGYYRDIGNGYIIMDDQEAGASICRELIEKGHKRIGGLFKSDDIQGHKRYQGFSAEMSRHGLPIQDEEVVWYTTEDLPYLCGGSMDSILLKRLSDVTALVCYNDHVAISMWQLFERNGLRVPEDRSIVGIDNSSLATLSTYSLTSFEYPAFSVGESAAAGLLQLLEGEEEFIRTVLHGNLVVRDSVMVIEGN